MPTAVEVLSHWAKTGAAIETSIAVVKDVQTPQFEQRSVHIDSLDKAHATVRIEGESESMKLDLASDIGMVSDMPSRINLEFALVDRRLVLTGPSLSPEAV